MLRLNFSYPLAAGVGTVAGMVNSYVLNKYFTFRSPNKCIFEKIKFLAVNLLQYLCVVFVIYICVTLFNISAEIAGLIAVFFGMFITFLGYKYWSFRR